MSYLPPASIAPVKLSQARAGSLVITAGPGSTTWLISNDENAAAIAVAGEYAGRGFEQKTASNWQGTEYLGARIELDETTRLPSTEVHAGVLYMDRSDTSLKLVYKHDNGNGSAEWRGALVATGLPEGSNGMTLYFTKWRLVVGEGRDKTVLLEVDAGKKAS